MQRRKLVTGFLLAAGSVAGSLLFRRRAARRREHVDLYFVDGSMLSLTDDSPEAGRLLPLARDVLASARR